MGSPLVCNPHVDYAVSFFLQNTIINLNFILYFTINSFLKTRLRKNLYIELHKSKIPFDSWQNKFIVIIKKLYKAYQVFFFLNKNILYHKLFFVLKENKIIYTCVNSLVSLSACIFHALESSPAGTGTVWKFLNSAVVSLARPPV